MDAQKLAPRILVTLRDSFLVHSPAFGIQVFAATLPGLPSLMGMKRSCSWSSLFLDLVVAAGCVAFISYLDARRRSTRRREEKLDSFLANTFPASDPVSY
jgi:hypothetical protein